MANSNSEQFYYGENDEVCIHHVIEPDDENALYCHLKGKVCFVELIQNEGDKGVGLGTEALNAFLGHIRKIEKVSSFYLFASYNEGYYDNTDENGLSRLVEFYKRAGFEQLVGIGCNDDQIDMCLQAA